MKIWRRTGCSLLVYLLSYFLQILHTNSSCKLLFSKTQIRPTSELPDGEKLGGWPWHNKSFHDNHDVWQNQLEILTDVFGFASSTLVQHDPFLLCVLQHKNFHQPKHDVLDLWASSGPPPASTDNFHCTKFAAWVRILSGQMTHECRAKEPFDRCWPKKALKRHPVEGWQLR